MKPERPNVEEGMKIAEGANFHIVFLNVITRWGAWIKHIEAENAELKNDIYALKRSSDFDRKKARVCGEMAAGLDKNNFELQKENAELKKKLEEK